ncbi:MAG: peptidylprolyl isomerase [Oscillospiraceae bacterium]|nr:peptidylprolyl isomerase [Oscillospiraceae bacterium]
MKKTIAILLVVCLILGGAIGYFGQQSARTPQTPQAETVTVEGQTAAPADDGPAVDETYVDAQVDALMNGPEIPTLDLERLYAEHAPDEVILTVDGREETWGDYFYFLASQVDYVESYFSSMASYYGMQLGWGDVVEGEDTTYADLTAASAEDALRQFAAIEGFARENGVELTDANREAIAGQLAADIASVCGEDGTEADFEDYLGTLYMSRAMYDRINAVNALYQEGFLQLYGENGETLDDEAALRYLEDNAYVSANHILLMTLDAATGEPLDEAAAAEKAATAQRLADELKAIEDPEERLVRFEELKEEYCEDTGKAAYPKGYTFTPGTMVTEFEDACAALGDYEVSDPVQSSYGYHVILKLPADAEAQLFDSSGSGLTARAAAANAEYGERLQAYLDALTVEYVEGFEAPDLLQYAED